MQDGVNAVKAETKLRDSDAPHHLAQIKERGTCYVEYNPRIRQGVERINKSLTKNCHVWEQRL